MTHHRIISLLALLLSVATVSAQRAIVTQQEYASIRLESVPAGAKVYLDGQLICASTPATVKIPFQGIIQPGKKKDEAQRLQRSAMASALNLLFVKEGYLSGEEQIVPTIVPVTKNSQLNVSGGLMGSIVNSTVGGKNYQFNWPANVIHEFAIDPQSANSKDPTIRKGEANKRVNRDQAGQTALERTIIRWAFESDPPGARVFWRVISSVPDEVKNTNETYLGTTPFEETRSFNILGLTYENSRDVQIEVKVRRKGYIDQSKRFNVRQAIDQQEISSFFDLVKSEEE